MQKGRKAEYEQLALSQGISPNRLIINLQEAELENNLKMKSPPVLLSGSAGGLYCFYVGHAR